MNYRKIRVTFFKNELIKKNADSFRKKFWDSSIPVDIEKIIAVKLRINVIPSPGLERRCDVDALIASNWENIYVDYDRYSDDRYQNRLRFSLAHEMGHFVLHKDIWSSFKIKETLDFYKLIKEIPQETYYRLEFQAKKFADYLLLPREILIIEREKAIEEIKSHKITIKELKKNELNSYLAVPIAKAFFVSEDVAQIALNSLDY